MKNPFICAACNQKIDVGEKHFASKTQRWHKKCYKKKKEMKT